MKRILLYTLMALVLAFTQCKKGEIPTSNEGAFITLTAGYGGDRTAFSPETGAFVWSSGVTEYVYVGGNQHEACLGVLSGTGTGTSNMTFSGTLTTTPNEGETLHFFYLGKGKDGSAVSTLDFSNQEGTLADVTNYHVAKGDGSYSSGTVNYETTLNMAMSIAYFDVNGFKNINETAETVYLHGDNVYSKASINYQNGTIVGSTKGFLNLGTANSNKYVALIPSVETATDLKFESNSKTGSMTFNRGIRAGKYYVNNSEALTVTANALPEGATSGLFSVSATEMVRFSKGNLQYIGSAATPYWKFAENQWDCFRQTTGQSNSNTSPNIDRDLFCWGTSSYNHGAVYYQPYQINGSNSYYYPYGNKTGNLYDYSGNADWGYNAISNGGNEENRWRTPNSSEFYCILRGRTTVSGSRFVLAKVANTNGLIVFPDNWDNAFYAFININEVWNEADFEDNIISEADWNNIMAVNGAVFLPAAGRFGGFGPQAGEYWESDFNKTEYGLYFANALHFQPFADTDPRTKNIDVWYASVYQCGYAVRLVLK